MNLYDLMREYRFQHGADYFFKQFADQIHSLEVEKAQFAMDAKNAKDRAALLETQVKELETKQDSQKSYIEALENKIRRLNHSVTMKVTLFDIFQQWDKKEAQRKDSTENLKAKLRRKNERIQRLENANQGYRKGIRRLRKRIYDMERIAFIHKDGIRSMRQQVSDLMKQCNQLRDELAQVRAERDNLDEAKLCFDAIIADRDADYAELSKINKNIRRDCNAAINSQTQRIVQLQKLLDAYRELARKAAELEKKEGQE